VRIVGDLPEEPSPVDLHRAGETLVELRKRLAGQFESARRDMERLDAAVPEREKRMNDAQKKEFAEQRRRLTESMEDVEQRFADTEGVLQNLQASLAAGAGGEVVDRIVALGVGLSGLTQELALVKARARLETVTVPHIELEAERALDIARANRLDWMNNRASLVDQWRLITYNANLLKAGLDLTFSGDMGTVNNQAFAFNGRDGNLRVGVRFDAPFTRRLQRNDYRSALIFYQQQRRALYQYQDGVYLTLRQLLRQLAQLEENLEIQRRAVVIAIRRVDKTREDLNRPPAPVEPGMPVEALGPTVGQNLIFALNDLTNAQNNLMSVVLNYYEARMLLYRNLGIMDLDDCGMWIERPIEDAEWLTEADCPMPPSVPQEWMDEAGVDPREVDGPPVEGVFPAGGEICQVKHSAAYGHFAELIPSTSAEADAQTAEPGSDEVGESRAYYEQPVRQRRPAMGVPLLELIKERSPATGQGREPSSGEPRRLGSMSGGSPAGESSPATVQAIALEPAKPAAASGAVRLRR
jgi:hypothetical protein